jgi:hypothetical protein
MIELEEVTMKVSDEALEAIGGVVRERASTGYTFCNAQSYEYLDC